MRISDWSSDVCSSDLDKGKAGKMPKYVTESGYNEFEDVRTRVGRKPPLPHSLKLIDLDDGSVSSLDLKALPGIDKDPLARLRKAAGKEPLKRSEEHTSELQSLMRTSYAVFCVKKKRVAISRAR